MSIKLSLLKSGETLISDIKEIVSEDSETGKKQAVAYLLSQPHVISIRKEILITEEQEENTDKREIQIALSPWIVLSADEEITIPTNWVVAVVEPIESVKQMYKEKTNG